MPIPEVGEYFRLLNYQSENVLVANRSGALTDYNKYKPYDNQIFELISHSDGTFNIRSAHIYIGNTYGLIFSVAGAVGVAFRDDPVSSEYFTFEEGSGYLEGYYRLVTPFEGLVITDNSKNGPSNYRADGVKAEDQYFEFQTHYGEVTKSAEA